jgi:hypothetical protein
MEVLLEIHPTIPAGGNRVQDRKLYFTLQRTMEPKSEGFGHAYVSQDMEIKPILQMGYDKMIPRHVYDKHFTIRFPNGRRGFNPIEWGD